MNKKKHQGNPGDESTESCDENDNAAVECPHIRIGVDQTHLKKALIARGFLKECEMCSKGTAPTADSSALSDCVTGGDYEFDSSLWMCLRCGYQGCGRARNQHALAHYRTSHSDCHALCVNTTNWNVWCYACDDDVNITCRKKLLEAIDYLRSKSNSIKSNQSLRQNTENNWSLEVVTSTTSTKCLNNSLTTLLPRPRGLSNLGNTCFFNSVLQCLGQTPHLVNLLNETAEPGQYFCLPGGKLNNDADGEGLTLEPLEGTLEKWRPLTQTLADTLIELQNGRTETYMPRNLLSRLTHRMPQFAGGQQHDAHELLRHLLEAVREEDLKRYQSVILEKLGLNTKTDPSTVEGDKKKIIKFYGQQASELLLPTEQVFRGVLVSTLQCQDCQHTSHRDEFFLDLSLPISEKQLPPILRRKADDLDDVNNKQSKHQIKKEKRAERKKNKKQNNNNKHSRNNFNISNQLLATNSTLSSDVNMKDDDNKSDNENNDSESDADIEDNVEDNLINNNNNNVDMAKGMESGYNSDKIDNSSPDSNNRDISPTDLLMPIDDSGVPSPAIGMLSASHCTPDNSPSSSETNIDMGSPLGGRCTPDDEVSEFDRPESRLSFLNKSSDLKMDLSKLSLINNTDSNNKLNLDNDDEMDDGNYLEGACSLIEPKDEKMDEDDEDSDLWTGTISARYQCEDGEYSVQSCLNQFTACELMTGNNKVSCELCTKRYGGTEKKTVYTNATKQLLIYNPPAVLILHLKRFQVYRFRSAKVSKFVKFPTLLDLAPFCSKRSQNLPTFEMGQTKVLYSLYGVVEHSGSIHGGHYVAYVKVRERLERESYRWQFLPKNQRSGIMKSGTGGGALGEPEVPPGKWYYISDSHVSEVSECKVLSAQAYLLFYERIL